MADRHDYVALEWVKGEIAETLKQARQALEDYVDNPKDASRLSFCLTYIHQVHGTLQMVEFFGAALLAEEMEYLAKALLEERVANVNEAQEVMMEAILQLPLYLDSIQVARRDLPMAILPLLNDLRAARGDKLLSESSLFNPASPPVNAPLSEARLQRLNAPELQTLLRKLRQMFQMAMIGLMREQNTKQSLGYLARVFVSLEKLSHNAPLEPLWQVAVGLVDGLANQSLDVTTSVRSLLRQLDTELRELVQAQAQGLNKPAPEDLLKNLLFYIAKAQPNSSRLQALHAQYRLAESLPTEVSNGFGQTPDRGTMRSVVTALCEELVRVKDILDLFVRGNRNEPEQLASLREPLKQIADTLAVLGFSQPRKILLDQDELIHAMVEGQQPASDALLMDIAGALLYVEATLTGMAGPIKEGQSEKELTSATDVLQVHRVVIKEARTGLEQAKDGVIEFIASQWQHEHLQTVPDLLSQVRGGLEMIGLPRVAHIVNGCRRYIVEQLLERKLVPNWQDLDTLADAITSVEYYLERLYEDHEAESDAILDTAEHSLVELGYPVIAPDVSEAETSEDAEASASLELTEPLVAADEPVAVDETSEPLLTAQDDAADEPTSAFLDEQPATLETELELEPEPQPAQELELTAEPEIEQAPVLELTPALSDDAPDIEQPVVEAIPDFALTDSQDDDEDGTDFSALLGLPEVELPEVAPAAEQAADSEEPSAASIMAAPTSMLNPPAGEIPEHILPPPEDEEPTDEELREIFIEEAGEVLETIAEYFPQWRSNLDNKAALAEVRRAFHTLKGSGRMVRALVVGELAWSIENLLNRVIEDTVKADAPVMQVIEDVIALTPQLVDEYEQLQQRQRDDVDRLAATAHALARGKPVPVFAALADAEPVEEAQPLAEPSADVTEDSAELDLPELVEVIEAVEVTDAAEVEDTTDVVTGAEDVTDLTDVIEPADTAEPAYAVDDEAMLPVLEVVEELPVEDAPATTLQVGGEDDLLDAQLVDIFYHEAQGHLQALVTFLADCTQRLPLPVSDDLQRAMHTLKGSAYMAGISPMAEIANPLEKLVKEYRAHMFDIEHGDAFLLSRAEQQLRIGLEQIKTTPLQPIPGSQELIADLQTQLEQRLAVAMQQTGSNVALRDPLQIAEFLADGTDLLLDMDEHLERWHQEPAAEDELVQLMSELVTLKEGAGKAELAPITSMCAALIDFYAAVTQHHLAIDDATFAKVASAHDALINMMDQVAAGLEVEEQPQLLATLQQLVASNQAAQPVEPQQASEEQPAAIEPPAAAEPVPVASDTQTPIAPTEQPTASYDDFDEEMVEIFLDEAMDLLDSANHGLEQWLETPDNHTLLNALMRDLHTLKGGAGMADIKPIGDLAHELESVYEGLLDGRYKAVDSLSPLLLSTHDHLVLLLEQLQAQQNLVQPVALIERLRGFRKGVTAPDIQTVNEPAALPPTPEIEAAAPVEVDAEEDVLESAADSLAEPEPPIATPSAASAPSTPDYLTDTDPELVEIFLEEAFELLEGINVSLQLWLDDTNNVLQVSTMQRYLHTLKGGARMAEITEIGDLAHALEDLYEDFATGRLPFVPSVTGLMYRCHDALATMLEAVRDQQPCQPQPQLVELIARFRADPNADLDDLTGLDSLNEADTSAPEADVQLPDRVATDVFRVFLTEAEAVGQRLQQLIHNGYDAQTETQIQHTQAALQGLKGGAQLAGLTATADLCRQLEGKLQNILNSGATLEQGMPEIEACAEHLQHEFTRLRDFYAVVDESPEAQAQPEPAASSAESAPESAPLTPVVAEEARPAPESESNEVAPAPAQTLREALPFLQKAHEAAQQASAQPRGPQEQVRISAELLEGLVNLAGETSIFRGRVEQQVSDFGYTLHEMEATLDRIRDQLRRLDTETQAQILSGAQAEAEHSDYEDFDPLEMDRHSHLQQLSRSLFESASDLIDLKDTLAAKGRDAETLLLQQARVNTELQEGLMRTRMVPFDRLIPRLRRIVRQVSIELGKKVDLQVANAEGEVDRTVLERMVAPLEHMIRNAVGHGLELPAERLAKNKPEEGTIMLELGREGANILLTVSDDGAGVNVGAVRKKAIERGLMTDNSQLGDQDIIQFILHSGFSTAEQVTQVSGRGVGMDVVNSEIKQLGGNISIESEFGEGTRFLIRLPFTVSVNRALMVMAGEDSYAVPLNTIEGIVRVSPYELEALYEQARDEGITPRLDYAGQEYELRYIGDLLNNGQHPKLTGHVLPLPVILTRSSDHAVAVQVDELSGSREIVVKSLGPQFSTVPSISGATILGDGRVVVILDLIAAIRSQEARALPYTEVALVGSQTEAQQETPLLVMIVDDSVTVRKVTSRLLERHGMHVMTAVDGVDAINQLQEKRPDIMLLDIEMPRMDGFEVASLVRHDSQLKDLPIIMITSRTGDKHRERALAIGVNEYLGKPYQEAQLLETIQQLAQ